MEKTFTNEVEEDCGYSIGYFINFCIEYICCCNKFFCTGLYEGINEENIDNYEF